MSTTFGSVTYSDVIVTVSNWIKTKCENITNYDSMNAYTKNGTVQQIGTSGATAYVEYAYRTSYSPLTAATSSATVDTDFANLVTLIGLDDYLYDNITFSNYWEFVNNIVSFCATKLGFIINHTGTTSTDATVKYLIYNTTTSYTNTTPTITIAEEGKIIAADLVLNTMFTNLIEMITRNVRVLNCSNTFSLS